MPWLTTQQKGLVDVYFTGRFCLFRKMWRENHLKFNPTRNSILWDNCKLPNVRGKGTELQNNKGNIVDPLRKVCCSANTGRTCCSAPYLPTYSKQQDVNVFSHYDNELVLINYHCLGSYLWRLAYHFEELDCQFWIPQVWRSCRDSTFNWLKKVFSIYAGKVS